MPCWERCAFAGLTTWLSSSSVAEKTMTRPEVGEQLIHALPKENQRAAARSLRYAKRMDVPRVDYEKLASDRAGEASEAVRQRVPHRQTRKPFLSARWLHARATCAAVQSRLAVFEKYLSQLWSAKIVDQEFPTSVTYYKPIPMGFAVGLKLV